MSNSPDRLYELLPRVYRQQDAEQGYPLRALLQVISEQANLVEDDITRLYDNWFIETCQDWVVPYLGDLIGYRPIHEAGEPDTASPKENRKRNKFLIPRREVANTIAYRRRKGTLPLLEKLAWDVAGWAAHAVEFYPLLGLAQPVNHLRPGQGGTADLRDNLALDRAGGPYDSLAHTIDVRRITSGRTQGRYNLPGVGLFVWRLQTYRVTRTPAYYLEEVGANCFTFSVLGHNTPLFTSGEGGQPPVPITRRDLARQLENYYGPTKSLCIWLGSNRRNDPVKRLLGPDQLVVADLDHWRYRSPPGKVAIDPELGRIIFPANDFPRHGVWVSYYYGMSAPIGGGEYDRPVSQPAGATIYPVLGGTAKALNDALGKWLAAAQLAANAPSPQSPDQAGVRHGVIEIKDSGVYTGPFSIEIPEGCTLQIRAASGCRPVLRLLDVQTDEPDALVMSGGANSSLTLDGLLITGRGVEIDGSLANVTFRHCTLVPGWGIPHENSARRPDVVSLEIYSTTAQVVVEHSIIGAISQIPEEIADTEPVSLKISDSIVDASSDNHFALSAPAGGIAHVTLSVVRTTVIGQVYTHAIDLAENSIFSGRVRVARRQTGCMRFCTFAPGSRTPQPYECPVHSGYDVTLQFNSATYGSPAYGQLAFNCARQIRQGADDESEMGAFHDLFQPQREANLKTRLAEYTLAGMDAGLIFLS